MKEGGQNEESAQGLEEKKEVKLTVVVTANAVTQPEAVMIVSFNTNSAFTTVTGSILAKLLTFFAPYFVRFIASE